jgi:hypothetical protein
VKDLILPTDVGFNALKPGSATLTVTREGSAEVGSIVNFQGVLNIGTSMLAGSIVKLQIPNQQLV